ncbi:nuclease-related domain-containing protein [Methylobacter sp. S3L5C]|uniref:nuclease-related domain-containing protein n=1 Tax=Methylobacter sp. S3L5C TaxID=2839024 RepID=UPI001FAD7A2D|nr:nuclease-related domain-containing protein [Methylobacter sp. S3L5C]UOA07348.1 NERD domain-containing protein [Methylobacter sp. S3L5C]
MNIQQILINAFTPFIKTYWWIIPLLFLLSIFKTPFMKGMLGELFVNIVAKVRLDKRIYTLFKNITLPTEDGTTQIDHVIVSRHGVFVIETKNMKGWIFGDPQQKTWTQKIYRHTTKFQNPLHQNYKHTQTLQAALELDSGKVFSVVIFVGDSTFKTTMPENVVYAGGYIRFIKSKKQLLLSDHEVAVICNKIKANRLKPSLRTHINHVKHVKTIVVAKQKQDESFCLKCGKPMVLRTARSGVNQGKQFLGCTGYPACRAIKEVL